MSNLLLMEFYICNYLAEPKRRVRVQNRDDSEDSEDEKENREFKTPKKLKKMPSSKSTHSKKRKKPPKFIDDEVDDDIDLFVVK